MFAPGEPQWNKSLLRARFRQMRAGWRDVVLGDGWRRRKAEARWERGRKAAAVGYDPRGGHQ